MTIENRRAERWHIGKEVPIILVFGLLLNAAGWIWFAATQTAQLNALTILMAEFRTSQYTQADASRDKENSENRSAYNSRRIDEIVRRVEILENK